MSVNNPRGNLSDRCQVCSFVFINIKRKRNLNGEFMKIFEVFNRKVLPDDGLPRGVCDTCHGTNIMEKKSSKKNWYAFVMAAVEKIKLFPNPVGNCPKTSLLPTMFSRFCSDFNSLTGNTAKLSLSAYWRSSTNLTFSVTLAIL